MAARLPSLQEVDFCCAICYDIFKDPVVLNCSHSFCSSCLREYWAHRAQQRDCPLCRSQSDGEPVPSLTLRNLCEAYVSDGAEPASLGSRTEEDGEMYSDPALMCPDHGERLKLFCLEDQEPICVVCQTSRKHKQHECCPVEEAVADLKEEIRKSLSSRQEMMSEFKKVKLSYEDTAAHIQTQAQFVERRTRHEFQQLRQFLEEAEHVRMAALKEEEEEKSQAVRRLMDGLHVKISSLSDDIKALEEAVALDGVPFLKKSKNIRSGQTPPECAEPLPAGALINVAEYLGSLKYSVLVGMKEMVRYTPVTLDPNTAAPWLRLSDDLTEMSDGDDHQKLPDNPERYDRDAGVLGHRGFQAGSHWWDVEVGGNTAWVVGVAGESVKRKEKVPSVKKNGYITVYFYHEMYFAGTSPLTRLIPKTRPQRIRVRLECDKGKVSFYDPAENSLIYTFKHTFTEKVYPYFWVGCQRVPLKILAGKVLVKVDE